MKKIIINIPNKKYNVYLGNGIFNRLTTLLKNDEISGDILLVIDSKVKKLYSEKIAIAFKKYPSKVKIVTISSSEKNKSFVTLQKIHSALIKNNFGRDSIVAAIGGGIVGDIAGFAASTYMRGIKYIQIPTTLLASVDSSVGGKTGINYSHTKNIIGSFYQPEIVIIDISFFNTLPDEEKLCGLGEIIKYCFLTNSNFFNYVNKNANKVLSNDSTTINRVITESINFKGGVVEADEKEAGIRKVLNLGHTFAHAFEVQQNHKLKHGQAVIVGITCAIYLSKKLNLISDKEFNKYLLLLTQFGQMIKLKSVDKKMIYKIMLRDKKNRNNEIKFVLLRGIGQIITDLPAPKNIVDESITEAISHFS